MRFLCLAACIPSLLHSRVMRAEITSRTDVLAGKPFGSVGSYQRIVGRIYFSAAVADTHNRRIVDLAYAVNRKAGEVEFSADFTALCPKDSSKGNGSLLLEVPNRGRSRIVALVDGGDFDLKSDAGDGWLLRNGYSIAALGWQWDATGPDTLALFAPIAKENGRTIEGLLRGDLMPSKAMPEIPLGHLITGSIGGLEYPVSKPDDARNTLTVRDSPTAERITIPRTDWQFAHRVGGNCSSVADTFI